MNSRVLSLIRIQRKNVILYFTILLFIVIGLIFLFIWKNEFNGYKVLYNHGDQYSENDYRKNVSDGVNFVKIFVREYTKSIDREVHNQFKKKFRLLKQSSVSAKLVISSFEESLIYIFPAAQNQIIIDNIDFPAQTALCYGLIDLNNPKKKVNLRRVYIKVPLPEAINKYNSEPGGINIIEGYGGAIFSSVRTLSFDNYHKIFSFKKSQTILGIMGDVIAFKQSNPLYVQIYGHTGYHEFNIQGVLIISNENTFNWTFEMARKIASQMVEIEIKDLLVNSEFFKLSLADDKLRPMAQDITRKKSRSEKDQSYLYTLWEFKKDINDLKEEAKKYNIDSSYVDELLKDPSLKPVDGTLFFYYENEIGFMLQWSLMNFSFFVILLIITHIKYGNAPLWTLATRRLSAIGVKLPLIALITTANGWIFSKKPESITITYWIIPCILWFIYLAYSLGYTKHYNDTPREI